MDKKERSVINTNEAPGAVGPYSQGISYNGLFYFSGQIALDPQSGKLVDGGVEAQARQVLQNINALLKSQNLTAQNVLKTTVFITDITKFSAVNSIYAEFFNAEPPARSCVEVSKLPLGAAIEIEIVAGK